MTVPAGDRRRRRVVDRRPRSRRPRSPARLALGQVDHVRHRHLRDAARDRQRDGRALVGRRARGRDSGEITWPSGTVSELLPFCVTLKPSPLRIVLGAVGLFADHVLRPRPARRRRRSVIVTVRVRRRRRCPRPGSMLDHGVLRLRRERRAACLTLKPSPSLSVGGADRPGSRSRSAASPAPLVVVVSSLPPESPRLRNRYAASPAMAASRISTTTHGHVRRGGGGACVGRVRADVGGGGATIVRPAAAYAVAAIEAVAPA